MTLTEQTTYSSLSLLNQWLEHLEAQVQRDVVEQMMVDMLLHFSKSLVYLIGGNSSTLSSDWFVPIRGTNALLRDDDRGDPK